MICPSCGHDNTDSAGQCVNCHHNFRFGYAFDDPANMTIISWDERLKHKTKLRVIGYLLLFLAIMGFALVIVLSLTSAK